MFKTGNLLLLTLIFAWSDFSKCSMCAGEDYVFSNCWFTSLLCPFNTHTHTHTHTHTLMFQSSPKRGRGEGERAASSGCFPHAPPLGIETPPGMFPDLGLKEQPCGAPDLAPSDGAPQPRPFQYIGCNFNFRVFTKFLPA